MNKPYSKITIPRFKKGLKFPTMSDFTAQKMKDFQEHIGTNINKHAKLAFKQREIK